MGLFCRVILSFAVYFMLVYIFMSFFGELDINSVIFGFIVKDILSLIMER